MSTRSLRRAHLISPFGVGAMVDFPGDEALMVAGLDEWPKAHENCPDPWRVTEERLQARLSVSHFRLPPEHRTESEQCVPAYCKIPMVRFPRWHYCPRCGHMELLSLFHGSTSPRCKGRRCRQDLHDNRRPRLLPMRILAVCEEGHIQDFPFMSWVHPGGLTTSEEHSLTYRTGQSATLAGIYISCSCGSGRSLSKAFNFSEQAGGALHEVGADCSGAQPWLGRDEDSRTAYCGRFLRVVQRGATNVYFPHIVSSIYLPLWGEGEDEAISEALENPTVWRLLTDTLEGGRISADRAFMVAEMRGLDAASLRSAAQKKLDGEEERAASQSEEDFRRSEYDAIRAGRGDSGVDLLVERQPINRYKDWMSEYFDGVCLLRKLRETRVLAGFSRLRPPGEGGEEAIENLQELGVGGNPGWLPAMVVRGEGIFIEFSSDALQRWQNASGAIAERAEKIRAALNRARDDRGLAHQPLSAKYVMLHTFAHLLIRQLCFECGYGSASLRERLYCNLEPGSDNMHGVLIYTAAGDSEGTLGGLVRQGEPGRLEASIDSALRAAEWCSSDPICIESTGQGIEGANLAACHGCCLVPETSCEQGNRLLDRGMVVGRPGARELGYFSARLF